MRTLAAVLLVAGACASSSGPNPAGDGGPTGDGKPVDGHVDPPVGPRLIPGPGEAGFDASLADKARAYDRQFHTFSAAPFGLSLDAFIPDANDQMLVDTFLAQTATDDFAAFTASKGTPRTVHDIVSIYDEHGDLGMFAGAAAAGD